MRQASKRVPESAEKTVRDIRRATRRHHSAEEKIRIVLEGLRGEDSIAELCRKEGINQNLYYRWSKEFLEAGKKRLAGDTAREATSDEVKELKAEARQTLKFIDIDEEISTLGSRCVSPAKGSKPDCRNKQTAKERRTIFADMSFG
jgi:transposase